MWRGRTPPGLGKVRGPHFVVCMCVCVGGESGGEWDGTDGRQTENGEVNVSTQREQRLWTCLGRGRPDFVNTAKGRRGQMAQDAWAPSASPPSHAGAARAFRCTLSTRLPSLAAKRTAPDPMLTAGKKRFKVLGTKYQIWKIMRNQQI